LHRQALELAARTRDLRVAVWLARSGARLGGLVRRCRDCSCARPARTALGQVHPMLDAADNNDPTARASALQPLVHPTPAWPTCVPPA
jgi:type VI secretion system protein ImpA